MSELVFTKGTTKNVVGQKKKPLDLHKPVAQAEVIVLRKAAFTDILIVALGVVVGRVEVEESGRAVIVLHQLFKVLCRRNGIFCHLKTSIFHFPQNKFFHLGHKASISAR